MKTSVAIVDDHQLLAESLADLINRFESYSVLFCANNGQDMFDQLVLGAIPDIVLLVLDLNMPVMDGAATLSRLRETHPTVRVIALSMHDDEQTITSLIRQRAHGYLTKKCLSTELRRALDEVRDRGVYISSLLTRSLLRPTNATGPDRKRPAKPLLEGLNDRERTFVKLACSELTYVEIADRMCVSPRTVDGYRETVFDKWQVRTRVGVVMKAMRLGLA